MKQIISYTCITVIPLNESKTELFGAPGWLSVLRTQLLVSLRPWSRGHWDWAPHWAHHSVEACFLSLRAPSCSCACCSKINNLNKQTNEQNCTVLPGWFCAKASMLWFLTNRINLYNTAKVEDAIRSRLGTGSSHHDSNSLILNMLSES